MSGEKVYPTLTAKPGDLVVFERNGQEFGGRVWQPPSQPDNLLAGDTFIRLNGEWIATTEHVTKIERKHPALSVTESTEDQK